MGRRKAKPAPIASPTMVDESWFSMQSGVDWTALNSANLDACIRDDDINRASYQQFKGERRAAEMALWFEDFQRRHGL